MKNFLENLFIKNPYGAGALTFFVASVTSFLIGIVIKMFVLELFLISFATIIPTLYAKFYKEVPTKNYQLKFISTFCVIYFLINTLALSFVPNDFPKLLLFSVVLTFSLIIFGCSYFLIKQLLKNACKE